MVTYKPFTKTIAAGGVPVPIFGANARRTCWVLFNEDGANDIRWGGSEAYTSGTLGKELRPLSTDSLSASYKGDTIANGGVVVASTSGATVSGVEVVE